MKKTWGTHASAPSFCFLILQHHFLFPFANAEYDDGDHHAQCPGDHERAEQGDGLAVGEFRCAGEICQTVSYRYADENRGDHGYPHGGGGITGTAHDSAQNLCDADADIAHSHQADHPVG